MKFSRVSILFSILFYFSLVESVISQNITFSTKYSTLLDEVPTDAIETPDNGFIISAKQGSHATYDYHALLIKLDKNGDTVKTVRINDPSGNSNIYKLLKSNDNGYFGIGTWQVSADEMNIWLIKFSVDLNILWQKRFTTQCYSMDIAMGLRSNNGEIILYGNGYYYPDPSNAILIYRCNESGDSIGGIRMTQPSFGAMIYDMAEKLDSTGFYLMIGGRYLINTNSFGQIITLNKNLNLTHIDSIPRQLFHYYNIKTVNNHLFISGMKPYFWSSSIDLKSTRLNSSH